MLREHVAKPKKYKGVKPLIESSTSPIQEQLWACLLQLQRKEHSKTEFAAVEEREVGLSRLLGWDEKEVKRMLSRYQNHYK